MAAVDFTSKLGLCQIAAEGAEIRVLAEDLGDVRSSYSIEEKKGGETKSKKGRGFERHLLKTGHDQVMR